jgi:hypothetical protein
MHHRAGMEHYPSGPRDLRRKIKLLFSILPRINTQQYTHLSHSWYYANEAVLGTRRFPLTGIWLPRAPRPAPATCILVAGDQPAEADDALEMAMLTKH